MRFRLALPKSDVIIEFYRFTFKKARRFSKQVLQSYSDPDQEGETRAHLYIFHSGYWVYVRTFFVQVSEEIKEEIERYGVIE